MKRKDYKRYFWILLGAATVARLIYIPFPNLVPQEAYYWLYAKHLDLSYFDHPPLTAWTIAFFTYLGGDNHFFVRIGAVLYSTGTAIALFYLTVSVLRSSRLAFWTAVVMNCTVVFAIGSVIFTPDVPMTLFWTLAVLSVHRVVATGKWWWWYPAGIFLGLALLSKYPAGLLVPCTFLYLALSRKNRHWLLSIHPYMAIVLAFIVFSPVIIWNMQHDWASFAFQSTRRVGMMGAFKPVHFFELLGTQAAMLTPLIFVGMIYAMVVLTRRWWQFHNEQILFILAYSLPVLALFFAVSLRTLVKMNWPAPAYVTGIVGVVLIFSERIETLPHIWKRWVQSAITVGLALVIIAHMLPLYSFVPMGSGDTWSGWQTLSKKVRDIRSEYKTEPFIFSPSYKISSMLGFYLDGQPETYAENVLGKSALQFDYWDSVTNLTGQDGLLIYSDSMKLSGKDREKLERCFESIDPIDTLTVIKNNMKVRTFYLSKCYNYLGPPDLTSAQTPTHE